jgi:Na+/H+-dicarboxylate symporter
MFGQYFGNQLQLLIRIFVGMFFGIIIGMLFGKGENYQEFGE